MGKERTLVRVSFIHDDFLLLSKTARRLYHDHAASRPILDYHSHLPAAGIAGNDRFGDLAAIWLQGDHYKWRLMRANGVPERLCTGDAPPYEKFLAWARTVPSALRNPLYHWTHLELKRYFGIEELLNEASAPTIWERANSALSMGDLTTHGILQKFRVRVACTTDDPCDDLIHHRSVNSATPDPAFRIYPTFRPDRALEVDQPERFNAWVDRLGKASDRDINSLSGFLDALKDRHDFFHAQGTRLSDHGLRHCYANPCTDRVAASIFRKIRGGTAASIEEHEQFASLVMIFFGRLDAEKNWTKQLHIGAARGVNSRATHEVGADKGFDCIGDEPQSRRLCTYLDLLEQENALPKTIVYNVNPADNYPFATAAGSFNDASVAGKIQFGSAWWFLDQKDGMEWQINALSNAGLLSRFIGMTTDSRSFMSFPRHEYFRRVLCNLLGQDVEDGLLPNDDGQLGAMIRNICFENAREYLGLKLP